MSNLKCLILLGGESSKGRVTLGLQLLHDLLLSSAPLKGLWKLIPRAILAFSCGWHTEAVGRRCVVCLPVYLHWPFFHHGQLVWKEHSGQTSLDTALDSRVDEIVLIIKVILWEWNHLLPFFLMLFWDIIRIRQYRNCYRIPGHKLCEIWDFGGG